MTEWSSLAAEAKSESRRPGPKCQVKDLYESLPAADAEQLDKVLADKAITNPGIHRALVRRLGTENSPSLFSIGNHRRGNCRCEQ